MFDFTQHNVQIGKISTDDSKIFKTANLNKFNRK